MVSISGLIFDLDGTLVNSEKDIALSLNHTLRSLRFKEVEERKVRDFIGDGMRSLILRAMETAEEELLNQAITVFRKHYLLHCCDHITLYPGVLGILKFFSDKKLGIVTNKPEEMTFKILDHFKIRNSILAVFGRETTQNKKPHPEPILKMIKRLNVQTEKTMVIGDGTADVLAGKAAGALTCAVTYGYRERSELEDLNPDFLIDKLEDLKKIVR